MYCRKCGKTIPDDSVFCPYCGCAINPTTPSEASLPHRTEKNGKKQVHFLNPVAIITIAVVLGMALAVCGFKGIKAGTSGSDASVQSTVATAPPMATSEVNEAIETMETEEPTQETEVYDPWISCNSLQEAEEALGFGLELPEIIKDFEDPCINIAQDSSNLWVIFRKYTSEHDPKYYDNIITVSKMISIQKYPSYGAPYYDAADYDTKLVNIDGRDIVLLLDNREVVEADWVADGFGYSVIFENCGLTAYTVVPVLASIR